MNARQRARFDALLERVIAGLPPQIAELLAQIPVVVDDRPSPKLVAQLIAEGTLQSADEAIDLCGIHSGVPITDRSIDDPDGWGSLSADGSGPETIHLFRDAITDLAGGWGEGQGGLDDPAADDTIAEEIRITLLHEIGHHFGLDEDDLDELGYA